MAKKRSDRFKLLLDVVERNRKNADKLLGEAQQRVQQAKSGIMQLEQYQLEYQQQFQQVGRQGMDASQIAAYQGFLTRLHGATSQQREALIQSQAQLEKVEEYWRDCYAKHKAMEKLYQKRLDEEAADLDKQLQKQIDERSQYRRNSEY